MLRCIDADDVLPHTLAAMPWWKTSSVVRFALHRNMRAELDPAFAALCLAVGNGTLHSQTRETDRDTMATSAIELPHALFEASTDTPDKLLQWVYEGTLG